MAKESRDKDQGMRCEQRGGGEEGKRIKVCYVHAPTPHNEHNHYVM